MAIIPFTVQYIIFIFKNLLKFSFYFLLQYQFSSVAQSCPTLCNPMDCACQASLSINSCWSLLKLPSVVAIQCWLFSSTTTLFTYTCTRCFSDSFAMKVMTECWIECPAAAKSLESCLTLCDPINSSPPGSAVSGILQARTLEWVAISFSNAWKWKVKVKSLSHVLDYLKGPHWLSLLYVCFS